jgi:hypothetical protein
MMPVPKHLKGCVIPRDSIVDEASLIGAVKCPCGGDHFQLLYPGQTHQWEGESIPCTAEIGKAFFFLIKAKCTECGKEHLVIDNDFHGWNGFICHDARQAALPRPPLVPWKCLACEGLEHTAEVAISTEGKTHFVEETDGEVDEDLWPEGFGWITIAIECKKCGKKSPQWVSFETM